MKFLCVFCVVLYFQSGACLYPVDNSASILHRTQRNNQFTDQRNDGVPPNYAHNFRNSPSNFNYQEQPIHQQSLPVRTIDEPYSEHRGVAALGVEKVYPSPVKTEIKHETPNQENNRNGINRDVLLPSKYHYNQPFSRHEVDVPTLSYQSPRIPSVRKSNNPQFKSDESVQLELQAVSPKYIKSLIAEQKPLIQNNQDPSLVTDSYRNVGVDNLNKSPLQPDFKNYPTASFQNPTAEAIYKFKQAQPYRINTDKIINNPQGITHLNKAFLNSRRIQDIYKSQPPKSRYTILHPDGRIEHIDEVESIIARHPHYVLIKAEDIMKQAQDESNAFSEIQAPPVPVVPVPAITNIQQTNVRKHVNNKENNALSNIKNTVDEHVINNSKIFNQDRLSEFNKPKDFVVPDPVSSQREIRGPENKYKPKFISMSAVHPIEQSPKSATTIINAESHQKLNITELSTSKVEYQNVTEANVLLNNSPSTEGPNFDTNNFTEISISATPTPFTNESINLSVQGLTNNTNTQNLQTLKKGDEIVTSVSNTPLPDKENITDTLPFWFQADDHFWDKFTEGNNTRNLIYFLFLSPKPVEKKTTVTVYPNGTTIEEIIEPISGDDEVPKIIKSTTVKHKNSTSAY